MNRLDIVDDAIDDLKVELNKRVTVIDLYNQMKTKANIEKVKSLE